MSDAGKYSCEMTEKGDAGKTREFVSVSVFERQNEELVGIHDKENEDIDFIAPVDMTNVSNGDGRKAESFPATFISSSCVDSHSWCLRKHIFSIITCLLFEHGLL